jgi:hypothetical protein
VSARFVRTTSDLRYGRRFPALTTSESPDRILRRGYALHGIRRAAAPDELVDLLLHCLLDVCAFSLSHRRYLSLLVRALRAEPVSAGLAAERVERELSPSLPWHDLLAAVVQERWDDLLARRRRIARQLLMSQPLSTLQRAWASHEL